MATNKTLTVGAGTTRLGSASLAGLGVVDFSSTAQVDLTSDLVLANQSVQVTFSGTVTANGPGVLRNQSTLVLNSDTVNATLENHGTLAVRTASTLASLIAAPGSMVRVEAGFPASSILTLNNGFTNAGTLELVSAAVGWQPTLNMNSGTLVNTGTIQVKPGTGGLSTLNANLDNRGSLLINDTTFLNNATHLFSTETGLVSVATNKTLTVSGGTTRLGGATLTGPGAVDISSTAQLNLINDLVLTNQTVLLTLGGTVTVNGPGRLYNESTLVLSSDTVNATLENHGTVAVRTASTLASLIAAPGSTVRVEGGIAGNAAHLVVNNSFTNAGTLEMVGIGGWYPLLTVNNGPLVNTGTLVVKPGSGLSSTITAILDNRGSVTIDTDTTLSTASATNHNSGTITLAGGSLLVNQSSTADFDNDGTLNIGAGRTLRVLNGGVFRNNASGTLQGAGILFASANTFTNSGTIRPGEPLGALTVTGPLPQNFFCTVAIELGGKNTGHFDQIVVSGQVTFSGELNVRLANGFVPKVGDRFPIVTAAAAKGRFTCVHGLNLHSAGIRLEPVYTATGLELVANGSPQLFPVLTLQWVGKQLHLCWASEFDGFTPQSTTNLLPPGWVNLSLTATNRVLFDPVGPEKYYHLVKPTP